MAAADKGDELVATGGLRRLFRLAAVGESDVVLIEFKDRLARFWFAYIALGVGAQGLRVEVLVGPVATDAARELVADMLVIVTCCAARLYRRR